MTNRQKALLFALAAAAAGCASNPTSDADPNGDDDSETMESPATGDDDTTPEGMSGDSDAGGGGGATGECKGDTPANEDDLLATFEDMTVGVNPAGGWVGGFYIFNDKMNDMTAQMSGVEAVDRCGGESKYAYCTKGGGFTTWGAGFGTDLGEADMTAGTKETVDLSAYKGVSFWIRRNSGAMPSTVKLIVPDANTAEEGKACTNDGEADAAMKCDPFTANVPLSAEWTKQTITFDKLKQGGWGKPSSAFAKDKVFGIQLQFGPSTNFDVCFDQLVLVR
jgi:hypothetical protein